MIGRTVGNYTIVDKLGSGGMGEVYLAEHRRIARRAAIKFLLPSLSRDGDVVARFFNEARATSLIRHPGIVEIYDCDVVDERAYIVMEYLDGESLGAAIARTGGFPGEVSSIASVAGQIASALAAAHAKGIVHRDLKPENIFLALQDGTEAPFVVKILDFGIAKLAGENHGVASHTRTGSLLGTPVYMSPEQCRGLTTVDHRADIYALGCIMFELVTGRHVFVKEAPGDLLVAHISETAPTASSFQPTIPAALDQLIARMLSKDPAARPASMDAVVAELEELLGEKVAQFPKKIAATSTMLMPPAPAQRGSADGSGPFRTPARTTPMPSQRPPRAQNAAGQPLATPVAGGTKLLPNQSTFRHMASELVPAAPGGAGRRWLQIALAVVAGGAAVGGVIILVKPAAGPIRATAVETPPARPVPVVPAPAPRPEVAAPAAQPSPSDSDLASIRITSQPAGAELWMAGEAVSRGHTPLDVKLPRHSRLVDAILKQPGYVEKRFPIDPDKDQPINVELEREKTSHSGASRSARHSAAPKSDAKPKAGGYFGVGD
jgi:serine/threonine protein kinase